jgi:hypothetical protein
MEAYHRKATTGEIAGQLHHRYDAVFVDVGKKNEPDPILISIPHYVMPVRVELVKVEMSMRVGEDHDDKIRGI